MFPAVPAVPYGAVPAAAVLNWGRTRCFRRRRSPGNIVSGSHSANELLTLGLAAVLAILLALIVIKAWKKSRVSPEERERRRRDLLVAYGKMGDATLVETREGLILYSYDVRGMEYTASQDVSRLADHIPTDMVLSGPILVKYDPRNPANSIVVSERWCGLRASKVS